MCKENKLNENACSFLKPEIVQNIEHLFCTNPYLLEKNKVEKDKKLTCNWRICEFRDK